MDRVAASRSQVSGALSGVEGLADWVTRLGSQLAEVTRSLRDVSEAARNHEPFLLQAYRRDMGSGTYALMKDVSAPVCVDGRY